MNGKIVLNGIWFGLLSGCLLGFSLKAAEWFTGIKVYTLLMNIDFIPGLPPLFQREAIEFSLHLLVSFFIGILVAYLVQVFRLSPYKLSFLMSLLAALSYFPLTALAIQSTPSATNIPALFLWFLAHALYALCLGYLVKKKLNS